MQDMKAQLTLGVAVENAASMTALAGQLDDVAKVLNGPLQQAAQAAAGQLRDLARQDAAVENFRALSAEAGQARAALAAAERELANYSAQVGRGALATREEADALVRLQAAVSGARDAQRQNASALKEAGAELTRMGISTKDAGAAQERLRAQVQQVRTQVQGLVPAYQGAAQGAAQAGGAMERTHRNISAGVTSISEQLATLQSVFLAAAGANQFAGMAKSLAQTADQVSNLRARMELVTGAGKDFGVAWEGVQRVALQTHSALEETGALFTRIAQVGKEAGLSTQQASEQSLRLTQAINQAAQLSGASAEASSAAITQLIQGLQSGALRGDEFNSVMEQAPRLAKALADGLGVTTGELRKMAEAGALTSTAVIGALKGQSDTLKKEFESLPPTVGRALQDLSTQWTLYVAELDKGNGASAGAAQAIGLLAGNLRTVGGLLMDAGQALAAFVALGAAQHFYGLATASTRAAAEMATLGRVSTATAAQVEAAGRAAKTFDAIVGGLKTFALLTIITNFKDIGTWIGEAAAKLMGYRDRSKEIEQQERKNAEIAKEAQADRERMLATMKAAVDRQFDLSKAAATAVGEFARLTKEGTSAAEALKKVTSSFDISSAQGLKDFQTVLNKLAADGAISAGQVQKAWSEALKGVDLAQFEMTARKVFLSTQSAAEKAAKTVQDAMARGVGGAELDALRQKAQAAAAEVERAGARMQQAMDQGAREAVQRTGLDWAVLQGRIGEASRSAINDVEAIANGLQKLKAEGIDTGRALTASLVKAIDSADSQAAIDSVIGKIKELRGALGDKITDGLLEQAKKKSDDLKDALDAATPGINSLREALKELGVKPQAELDALAKKAKEAFEVVRTSGTATPREIDAAWKAMAEAAIAANNGVADAVLAGQAGLHGFVVETDAAGKSIVKSMAEAEAATRRVGEAAQQAGQDAKEGMDKVEGAAQSTVRTMVQLEGAARSNWNAQRDLAEQAQESNAAALAATNAWLAQQTQQSRYYGELWQANTKGAAATKDLAQALGEAQSAASKLSNTRGAPTAEHVRATLAQAQAMEALDAAQQAAARSSGDAQSGLAALEDRLLQLNGSEDEVARARAERDKQAVRVKMQMLQLDLERARIRQNDAEVQAINAELAAYARQIELIDQIYATEQQQREKRRREEEQAQKKREQEDKARAQEETRRQREQQQKDATPTPSPTTTATPTAQPDERPAVQPAPWGGGSAPVVNITLNANGVEDPAKLARMIEPELKRLAQLSR